MLGIGLTTTGPIAFDYREIVILSPTTNASGCADTSGEWTEVQLNNGRGFILCDPFEEVLAKVNGMPLGVLRVLCEDHPDEPLVVKNTRYTEEGGTDIVVESCPACILESTPAIEPQPRVAVILDSELEQQEMPIDLSHLYDQLSKGE